MVNISTKGLPQFFLRPSRWNSLDDTRDLYTHVSSGSGWSVDRPSEWALSIKRQMEIEMVVQLGPCTWSKHLLDCVLPLPYPTPSLWQTSWTYEALLPWCDSSDPAPPQVFLLFLQDVSPHCPLLLLHPLLRPSLQEEGRVKQIWLYRPRVL